MFKKITAVIRASPEEQVLVRDLLQRLGLAGETFTLSSGELIFGDGVQGELPPVLFEVSEVEPVYRVGLGMQGNVADTTVEVSEMRQTPWNSSLVTIQIGSVDMGFWSHNDPEKNRIAAIEGDLQAAGMRFGIVVSRWNQVITERLLHGALDALHRLGTRREEITIVRVPGAFEIPSAARTLAETGKVDAVIALGCLVRGETSHYEHIAQEATRGIGQSAQETGVPHAYGLLTCETLEQALDRAGLKAGNKGFEAAMSAVEMVSVGRKLRS